MSFESSSLSVEKIKKNKIRHIWRVAGILAIITAVEFLLAFTWPDSWSRWTLNALFLLLTVLKALYIVGEFMHLRYEVKKLIWAIVAPMVLIIWLVVALINEAEFISGAIVRFLK